MASRSSLEYVSSVALVFPTLVAVIGDEERSRVMSALAIISKLAQVRGLVCAAMRRCRCVLLAAQSVYWLFRSSLMGDGKWSLDDTCIAYP